MIHRLLLSPALAFVLVFLSTTSALSCACCSDHGQREIRDIRADEWILSEITRLQMDGTANVFNDACGVECIVGIENPEMEYQMTLDNALAPWELAFSYGGNPVGTISFAQPYDMRLMVIDTNPDTDRPPGLLYKEWQSSVVATGTGIFERGLGDGTAGEFVFQGQGNRCTSADDFTGWHLSFETPSATFSLFGRLLPQE